MGKRVRKAKDMKTPYTIILGDKDIEAGMITVETRGVETGTQMKVEDFTEKILSEIKTRSLS
jgi:threonyl-tRNA synthetase